MVAGAGGSRANGNVSMAAELLGIKMHAFENCAKAGRGRPLWHLSPAPSVY